MRRRLLELIGVAAAIMVAIVLAPVPAAGQAPTASAPAGEPVAKAGPAPTTPWGEPDLQGIWTSGYLTPLQRPPQYAGKEVFTDAEIAELDRRRAGLRTRGNTRAPRGTHQDLAGAYGDVFSPVMRTGRRTSLIVDPPDGRIPPLTPEVQKRRREMEEFRVALMQAVEACKTTQQGACGRVKFTGRPSPRRAEVPPHYLAAVGRINRADGPEDFGPLERCLGAGLPDFTGFRRIVQSPGSVSIFYDVGQGQGRPRVIPITTAPHLPAHVRQWWGDSRGRWEGNTLVVDVTNFNAKREFAGSRENLHLIERWTRIDANTLEYVVTIEDPTTWTRPWTVKQEMTKQNEQQNRIYYEPRCHEGNYAMPTMLFGSRAEEQAFAEGRGPDPATKCYVICGFGLTEEDSDPLQTRDPSTF